MKVKWSLPAFHDMQRIFQHIVQENPTAAREVMDEIYEGCESLKTLPNRGRVGRTHGRRELVFPSLSYIAVYQVKEDSVEIVRIYHAAQNWS